MDKAIPSTNSGQRARNWLNTLAVFAMVLVGGDGPLLYAYTTTTDPYRAFCLMVALIAFVFLMGGCFCYLAIFRPLHFYAPTEITPRPDGNAIYSDGTNQPVVNT